MKPPPDVLTPIAQELVGKSGLVAFEVVDVYDRHRVFLLPELTQLPDRARYVVSADLPNASATYLPDAQQRELQRQRARGDAAGANAARRNAESRKPRHRLYLLSDDERVVQWARGSRQSARAEIVSASFGKTMNDYVAARIVLRILPSPATAPTTQSHQDATTWP